MALAREKGYDKVSVEDIVDRADVARATFYAHYASKDAVLSAVFSDLIEELMDRIGVREGPWEQARPDAIRASYQHAAEMPDLYEVCLSDPRAREAYLTRLTSQVEQNFWMRLKAMGREPRLPVFIMARGFAGALLAVLESWLAGDIDQPADELAAIVLDLLVAGTAWGHNISLEELGYSTKPNPKPSKGKTAKNGGSTRKSPRPTRERLPVKAVPRTSGRTDRSVE